MHETKTPILAGVLLLVFAVAESPLADPRIPVEEEGVQGRVRVEESDGLRRLIIDGSLQASVPVEDGRLLPTKDPMVELLSAVWRGPLSGRRIGRDGESTTPSQETRTGRKALVIGLGSGRTAAALADNGFEVEVVELEPAVIKFARRFFGYEGHAAAGDGLRFLESTRKRYDLVLMDACSSSELPVHLLSPLALALMGDALRDEYGVIAFRLLASPADPAVQEVRTAMKNRFGLSFGSGVGDEIQNLYLITSERELNLVGAAVSGISVLAGPEGDPMPDAGRLDPGADRRSSAGSNNVKIVGYLTRDRGSNELCIDLPWSEMGAVRYVLAGKQVESLAELLEPETVFPTRGDLSSDGDVRDTLYELFGGGGFKRSATKFSPVVVVVEGVASVRSVLHPDWMPGLPGTVYALPAVEPRLPYGGVLYNLEVGQVTFSLTKSRWERFRRRNLSGLVRAAEKDLSRGRLARALESLEKYPASLAKLLGGYAPMTLPHADFAELFGCVTAEAEPVLGKGAAYDRAGACDRAWVCARSWGGSRDGTRLQDSLRDCAVREYRKVLSGSNVHIARKAAARLPEVLDYSRYDEDEKLVAQRDREIEKIRDRYPDVEPMEEPPTLKMTSPPLLRKYTDWSADPEWTSRQRIAHAKSAKLEEVKGLLAAAGVSYPPRRLLLRGFKADKEVEVWTSSREFGPLIHLTTYEICDASGDLGPKRREGDGQVPEGFYHLDYFNKSSLFHLSFRVNYPNASDRILGFRESLGGAIMFHGSCVSIGCLAMEDERIEELWLLTRALEDRGRTVHVHLLPARDLAGLIAGTDDSGLEAFWSNLKEGDDLFRKNLLVPTFSVDSAGRYIFSR